MKKAIAVIFIAGLLLRLAAVGIAVKDERYNPYNRVKGDSASYIALAISLIRGEGYADQYENTVEKIVKNPANIESITPAPTYKKPPGYPLFLALIFYCLGIRLVPVLVIQALLSALSVLVVYMIGREISSSRAALIASALTAFYYPFWYRATTIMVETLLVFLTVLFLYCFILWYKKMSYPGAVLTGLFGAVAFLVRPIVLPALAVFLVLAFVFKVRHNAVRFCAGTALMALAITVVLSPFAVRNYRHVKHFLITPTFGGYQFLLLYNPNNLSFPIYTTDPGFINEDYPGFKKYMEGDLKLDLPASASLILKEYEQDKVYGREAVRYMRANPGHFFRMLPRTFWNMWRFDYPAETLSGRADKLCGVSRAMYLFLRLNNFILYVCMIPFVLFGVYVAFKKIYEPPGFIAVFFCYFAAFHILIATNIRHRIGIMPVFFILAALGINEILTRKTKLWIRS